MCYALPDFYSLSLLCFNPSLLFLTPPSFQAPSPLRALNLWIPCRTIWIIFFSFFKISIIFIKHLKYFWSSEGCRQTNTECRYPSYFQRFPIKIKPSSIEAHVTGFTLQQSVLYKVSPSWHYWYLGLDDSSFWGDYAL